MDLPAATAERPGAGAVHAVVPGLPDAAYEHDGQLTKRDIRALTLARLGPVPGQLLWDVGAGAGSIAIEWSRAHPSCRAVAIESHPDRVARIGRNAAALGVPGLAVVTGRAPGALHGLERPDAIFVGGGVTAPGVLSTCWDALPPGGRLVVNAVTLESEDVITRGRAEHGGTLTRVQVSHAAPAGDRAGTPAGPTGWRPALPVTIWTVTR